MSKYLIYFLVLCSLQKGLSQGGLQPLRSNVNYIYKDLNTAEKVNTSPSQQKTQSTSLFLPFVEDFHYASTSNYPDQTKWMDSMVYINTGFPIAPPSVGVATFDGLNKHGYPYNKSLANINVTKGTDTLTSRPINLYTSATSQTLDPFSNVAISFYYQARGLGDSPEFSDTLLLDFYSPLTKTWQNVWFQTGNTNSNISDSAFKRGFVRIKDPSYFYDNFQFRFRNWASPTGDFDHWHLDYIFLDQGRADSLVDTVRNDITITGVPTPFLRNYSTMPFEQYQASEMAQNLSVRIRNNSDAQPNIGYKYRIYGKTGALLCPEYSGGFQNLNPFIPNNYSPSGHGYSNWPAFANPTVQCVFPPMSDSTDYTIKHFVFLNTNSLTASDVIKGNDTVTQYHRFRNYYAYDDGSAEAGYYVNATGASMAVKFGVNVFDSIYAVRIYFDPVGNVNTIENPGSTSKFVLCIWAEGANGAPGTLYYKDTSTQTKPRYINDGFKLVPEYKLSQYQKLAPGNYFIGLQQVNVSTTVVVGFDRNYDSHTKTYYDAGSGWTQSQFYGSLMIHPVFGKPVPPPVGISEHTRSLNKPFLVYPNPSSSDFTIRSENGITSSYQIVNTLGQLIREETRENTEHTVNTETFVSGVYFLTIKTKGQVVQQQKILIQH